MKRTNSCTTKKSFAEISIFLASKWFFISIFVVTILCYMTPVYYGDGVSEMSTLELLRLKANPSFAIEPMQYQISVILPRAVQGYLAMFVPVLSALPFIVFQQAEKSGRYQRFYMFRSTSSRQYYGKKWLFGMVTGGLVLLSNCPLSRWIIISPAQLLSANLLNNYFTCNITPVSLYMVQFLLYLLC